ncbi:hypothetical protein MKW98_012835 [Papaver atlanticum]|uniref:Uncharacterized protein n=1 Tax=Papaver atlanticum TaxID=357466 RepID=A0AAD4SMZ2_9MAGN|nr:hypothetical protein MKW98_012835 [Papaver atlanticum]
MATQRLLLFNLSREFLAGRIEIGRDTCVLLITGVPQVILLKGANGDEKEDIFSGGVFSRTSIQERLTWKILFEDLGMADVTESQHPVLSVKVADNSRQSDGNTGWIGMPFLNLYRSYNKSFSDNNTSKVASKHLKGGKEPKMDVLVMENLLFKRNVTRLYDLKGSSRSRFFLEPKQRDCFRELSGMILPFLHRMIPLPFVSSRFMLGMTRNLRPRVSCIRLRH